MTGRGLLAACAVALASSTVLLLTACGSGGEAASSPQPTLSTARETVVAFYEAHAEGREAGRLRAALR